MILFKRIYVGIIVVVSIFYQTIFSIEIINALHNGVVIQPADGYIVAAGIANTGAVNQFLVTRYTPSGALDKAFGSNGYVTTSIGSNAQGMALDLDAQSKILVAGGGTVGDMSNVIIARYTSSGLLDTTYGSESSGYTTFDGGGGAQANAIKIDSSGNSIVVGSIIMLGNEKLLIARFDSLGALDSTFNNSGYATQLIGDSSTGYAVAIQSDDKIVVGGTAVINGIGGFILWRFNANGTPDITFGSNGIVTTPFGNNSGIRGLAIQGDGNIVAAGYSNNHIAVARYNGADGSLDTTFGTNGGVVTVVGVNDLASSIAIQEDGYIVISGYTDMEGIVIRYNSTGVLDATFGQSGIVETALSYQSDAIDLAIQTNGFIVVVGNSEGDCVVARYDNFGVIDSSFGFNGTILIPAATDVYVPHGHVFSYDNTTQSVATANTMQDVTFNTLVSADGWTHDNDTAIFTCTLPGKYSINYELTVTDSAKSEATMISAHVLQNNGEISGSQAAIRLAMSNQINQLVRTCIANCFEKDQIKVQYTGSSTTNQIVAGQGVGDNSPSATITILCIPE